MKLAEALDDRGSFRRFCGFARQAATPERTAFERFRRLLVGRGLNGALFEAITAQVKAKAITVKAGTLADATIIASASRADGEGRRVAHKGRPATHGFKAHVGADASTALVDKTSVTSATSMTAAPATPHSPMILGRSLPTAPIAAAISERRSAPKVARHG